MTSTRASVELTPEVDMSLGPCLQHLLLTVWPAGGQQAARRNAWAGMAADAARGRARREAEAALAAAASSSQHRGTAGS